MTRAISRGDIYYIALDEADEKHRYEQAGIRPAVVLSNNIGNLYSPVVIVAPFTAKEKKHLPTHVVTYATGRRSTILCEQVLTISKDRLLGPIGSVSSDEMDQINRAVSVSLGLY